MNSKIYLYYKVSDTVDPGSLEDFLTRNSFGVYNRTIMVRSFKNKYNFQQRNNRAKRVKLTRENKRIKQFWKIDIVCPKFKI